MRSAIPIALPLLSILLLTGCWDKAELTEYGFVQAIALDWTTKDKVELTTHFYRPSGGMESSGSPPGAKGITIKTQADTVFEAVRDISIHFGRKPKWDHMRTIIIGEKLAQKLEIQEILDFFIRDHETRETTFVMIAEGKASKFLYIKPLIESTIGQQLRAMEDSTFKYSAKTSRLPLLDLAIQFKSETNILTVPYISKSKSSETISLSGIALLKDGIMTKTVITPAHTESLLMVLNKYQNGILEFPCKEESNYKMNKESFEVSSLDTKVTPKFNGNEMTVEVRTKIKGTIGELHCSSLKTKEDGQQFQVRVSKQVESNIRKMIKYIQNEKMDAIGIGNQIYRRNSKLWKDWKPSWDEHFSEIHFDVHVEVNVLNSGMEIGTPFGKKGG
ncbi:Ger(x)C family spore germination protein [Paenibacillus sp. HWE-109]|uniref:Ger(x)C family spore germination protein n=1 Tax=Paenibacillus sp. HWE-109 TaxID=1306526 RepID=UPI001EDF861D|nr:Ger(x)C family spore germination protein [Paenibacillus sp. HWE-109]UKS28250.1 Ger(x)C family spore germination protein [Paenibacillus sp. HWE-109]